MKKHKKLWITLIILAIVLALGIWVSSCAKKATSLLSSMSNSAKTATVEIRDITNSVSATGSVTSLSSHSLTSTLTGVKVAKLNVRVGDSVKKGDVICVLDDSELQEKLEDTVDSQEGSQKLTNIDIASAKRNLSDAQQTQKIQEERANENVDEAYGKYEKYQNKANEAYQKYAEAVNDTQTAKSKMEAAKAEYKEYKDNPPKSSEDMDKALASFEEGKDNLYNYLEGLKATVEGISTKGIKKLEVTNTLNITASDYYSGSDEAVISGINDLISALTKAQNKYTKASGELSEKISKKTAKLKTAYEEASKTYDLCVTNENTLKEAYEKMQEAVDPYLESYNQALENRDDVNRSNDQTVASRKDALNSTVINSDNTKRNNENTIDSIEEQISDCTVISDYDGIVTSLNLIEGVAYSGGTMITIEDTSSLEVTAYIDEYDIAKVSVGQKVNIKTNGTGDLLLEGVVKTVAPRATGASGTVKYEVIVSIITPCDDLRLDMTAKLEIIIEGKQNVLTVPYEAIMVDEKGAFYVEVLDSGNPTDYSSMLSSDTVMSSEQASALAKADSSYESHKVYVTKGLEGDYYVEIISDELTEGTIIVIPNNVFNDISSYMDDTGATGGF